MPAPDTSWNAPTRTWSSSQATRSARPRSPLGAALTILGLVSALFVAQFATASFGVASRYAESLKLVEPDPHTAAPPLPDLETIKAVSRRRLDTLLPVGDSHDAPDDPGDVALVSYTTAGDLPLREMTYDEFAADASQFLDRVPSLDRLKADIPTGVFTDDIDRQKEHIRELDEAAEITLEGFEAFEVNRSHQALIPAAGMAERIDPRMFIIHWTGGGYEDVDHFLRVMGSLSVQFFIDGDARIHELMASDRARPAHALGANGFSQGVEIETGHFDEVNSPLYGYTAKQITQTVYLAVDFLRRNDLPVDETTILGHYAADLIFANPYYDPHTGTFTQGRIRKFDPPEELMAVIINKAQALDEELGPRSAAPAPVEAVAGADNGRPANAASQEARDRKPENSASAEAQDRVKDGKPAVPELPTVQNLPAPRLEVRGLGR